MNVLGRLFLLLLGSIFLLGCAATGEQVAQESIYWPKPPGPPYFVYETTLRSGDSIRLLTAEDRFRNALVGGAKTKRIFAKPFDVAAKGGLVVVTDTTLHQGFIFNILRQKVYRFGHVGKRGVLVKPAGVAIGPDSQIYVADVKARRVFVYDAFGMYLKTIGEFGDLDRPVDVAVSQDGKRIYVVDAGGIDSIRHRLVVYDENGKQQFVVGRRGREAGEFNLPAQVAIAPDGTVYVLDAGNFRVQAFSPDGRFLRMWGGPGRAYGDLARPRGLAVDGDGNVYVTDAAYRNFQVFNPEGQLLLPIGGSDLVDKPGQFAMPAGIAVDELGHVYIVDQVFAKIEVIRRLGARERDEIVKMRQAGGSG